MAAITAVALIAAQPAAALVPGTAAAHGAAASVTLTADDGPSSPTLAFAGARTGHPRAGVFNGPENLLTTNTVPYDAATYNTSGLMQDPPGTFIRAGGGYEQSWTRDASVSSWNAASLLGPQVAANTLWSVVVKQPNGQLILQQDSETWTRWSG